MIRSSTVLPFRSAVLFGALLLAAACSDEPAATAPEVPAALFVDTAPAGAVPVAAARAAAAPAAEVVLTGRIAGRKAPFGQSSATFVVVDPAIEPCPPDEGCKTPWDCCCFPGDEIAANSATVQVVDASGRVLPVTLEGSHGLAPLAEVVVAGKVRSVDGGLVVDATQIHVRR